MKFLICQKETSMKFNLTVNSAWIRDCFAIWITHEPKLSRSVSPQPIFTSLIYVNCYIVVPLQHIGIWKRNIKHLYLFHKILNIQFTVVFCPLINLRNILITVIGLCYIICLRVLWNRSLQLHHFAQTNKQGKRVVPFPLRSP